MSGVDDGTGGVNLWQFVVGALTLLLSFFSGIWLSATRQGEMKASVKSHSEHIAEMQEKVAMLERNQTSGLERLRNLGDRVDRSERQHDEIRSKLGSMAEKIAQMPTREEINQGFGRIESQMKENARTRTH